MGILPVKPNTIQLGRLELERGLLYVCVSEKLPWHFECKTITCRLPAGDYVLNNFICERKGCVSDLHKLLMHDPATENKFALMAGFQRRYVICEFPFARVADFPKLSGIPFHRQYGLENHAMPMLARIEELERRFGVPFLFFPNRAAAHNAVGRMLGLKPALNVNNSFFPNNEAIAL